MTPGNILKPDLLEKLLEIMARVHFEWKKYSDRHKDRMIKETVVAPFNQDLPIESGDTTNYVIGYSLVFKDFQGERYQDEDVVCFVIPNPVDNVLALIVNPELSEKYVKIITKIIKKVNLENPFLNLDTGDVNHKFTTLYHSEYVGILPHKNLEIRSGKKSMFIDHLKNMKNIFQKFLDTESITVETLEIKDISDDKVLTLELVTRINGEDLTVFTVTDRDCSDQRKFTVISGCMGNPILDKFFEQMQKEFTVGKTISPQKSSEWN